MINRVCKRHRYLSLFFHLRALKRARSSWNYKKKGKYTFFITLPREITVTGKYRGETLNAIEKIKRAVLEGRKRIALDFSKTKKIIASGMITLYAEIHNILNLYPDIRLLCWKKSSDNIRQVLTQIGLYKLCKQKSFSRKPTRSDVIHWRVCSGVGVICEKIDKIVSEDELSRVSQRGDIYGGCVEATKNALRHAYPKDREGIPVAYGRNGWWCFSQIKDGNLMVVVCDLGVSIPYTLPTNFPDILEKLKNLGTNTDADIIAGALKRPRSSSGEKYRGNGLPKIMEVASVGGSLVIHSRRGSVNVSGEQISSKNYKQPLKGTIISWSLPLRGEE